MVADAQQEEEQTAQHQRGEDFGSDVIGRRPAIRIAGQRKFPTSRFKPPLLSRLGLPSTPKESTCAVGEAADEWADHALRKWLLELDLFEAAALFGAELLQSLRDRIGPAMRKSLTDHHQRHPQHRDSRDRKGAHVTLRSPPAGA